MQRASSMAEPITVLIAADGEGALRLRRRVGCAARALAIDLEIAATPSHSGRPRRYVDDTPLAEDLPRTEAIEELLRRRLAHKTPLRGVELMVREREQPALLGANGAGKSALAYTLMDCAGYAPEAATCTSPASAGAIFRCASACAAA